MPEILFVHGTGGRLTSYDQTVSQLEWQAGRWLNGTKVRRCLWGDSCGATFARGGQSIPDYDQQPAAAPAAGEAAQREAAAWRMLYDDPLFELRLLEPHRLPEDDAPGESPGDTSVRLLTTLQPPPDFHTLLAEKHLTPFWPAAYKEVADEKRVAQILRAAQRDPREVSTTLARALVAQLIARTLHEDGPGVSSATRDRLVQLLEAPLGGKPLGIFDWVTEPLFGLAKHYATWKTRRKRRALTDAAYPFAGDIVKYQANGDAITAYIRQRIRDQKGEVILLAHSLGGIACVDLLAREDLSDQVKGLITVGSQAPFLYEIDALRSLRCNQHKVEPLPAHFPTWLNFYDLNDFLSYEAGRVFPGGKVTDHRVSSGEPFPEAHSAYWDIDALWQITGKHFAW